MKLTYIFHDCFVLETDNAIIVFDYWKDPVSRNYQNPVFIQKADKCKNLYVIVSHHHKDHYVKDIFNWGEKFSKVKFIISKDIHKYSRYLFSSDTVYRGPKPSEENVKVLKPGETYQDNIVKIEAFESTDIGNSYVVEIEGKRFFHAGDLNAWIWKDESTKEEVEKAESDFKKILDKIKIKYPGFFMAMFPVDPRLGTDYFEGAKIFNDYFKIEYFLPMHFTLSENAEERIEYILKATDFSKYIVDSQTKCIGLTSPYSCFRF